jgi:septal ring factor EnvC (AmiA/AmiB activator)
MKATVAIDYNSYQKLIKSKESLEKALKSKVSLLKTTDGVTTSYEITSESSVVMELVDRLTRETNKASELQKLVSELYERISSLENELKNSDAKLEEAESMVIDLEKKFQNAWYAYQKCYGRGLFARIFNLK